MTDSIIDVAIIGAGPAASAAARLLASWGHSVMAMGRPPRHAPLAESLPPSCTKLFEQIGIREAMDAAKFVRATGNTVKWAGSELRVEPFEVGLLGYQVARNELDALMVAEARAIGAVVHDDATVREVVRVNDHWRVAFDRLDWTGRVPGALGARRERTFRCAGASRMATRRRRCANDGDDRRMGIVARVAYGRAIAYARREL